jgi:hypothetical protein
MEVTNGSAVFHQTALVQGLLTIQGGSQGTPIYTRVPMNLVSPYFTYLTAGNISNAYVYSNSNASGVPMNLQLPTASDMVTQWGNGAMLEFYIAQCGILAVSPPVFASPYYGIGIVPSGANNYITTNLIVTGVFPAITATIAPLAWDNSGALYPIITATYRCTINIQNSEVYYSFEYIGKPVPLAGW